MEKIKTLLIGILIGSAISAPLAYAAARKTLVTGANVELGTTANPIIITLQ